MKNTPGLKSVGFFILVLTVAVGVFAWAEDKAAPVTKHPKFIVKFGWEGATPEQSEPLNVSPDRIKKILKRFLHDPKNYRIRHYKSDGSVEDEGELQVCNEPEPTGAENRPTPTPRPYGKTEPSPTVSPAGNRTQTTGAVALSTAKDAQEFFQKLNTATEKK